MPQNAKPDETSGGHRKSSISNWKAHQKNSLQGFFSLTLPSGMVVHNCSFHRKDGSRWIGLPARQFTNADGSVSYRPLIEFISDANKRDFQIAALTAVDRFIGGSHE